MVNVSGIVSTLSAVLKPSQLLPDLIVKDIRQLDWNALHQLGIRAIVIDKDNCITAPGSDQLVDSLRASWEECRKVLGPQNVLIVSNSAGTNKDSLLLQAESLSRNVRVPVLVHSQLKPSYKCSQLVINYLSTSTNAFAASSHPASTSSSTNPSSSPPPSSASSSLLLDRMRRNRHDRLRASVVWNTREQDIEHHGTRNIEVRDRFEGTSASVASSSTSSSSGRVIMRDDISKGEREAEEVWIAVIGDRISTDTMLASRMDNRALLPFDSDISTLAYSPPPSTSTLLLHQEDRRQQPAVVRTLSILTTSLHARESLGTTILRSMEMLFLHSFRTAERLQPRMRDGMERRWGAIDWPSAVKSSSTATSASSSTTPTTPSTLTASTSVASLRSSLYSLLTDSVHHFNQTLHHSRNLYSPVEQCRSLFSVAERAMESSVVVPVEQRVKEGTEVVRRMQERVGEFAVLRRSETRFSSKETTAINSELGGDKREI